jgi:predicted CXXCH cytochrome family protein
VTFERRLAGDRVAPHEVPPSSTVTMTVRATVSAALPGATLVDHLHNAWRVVDTGRGTVTEGGAATSITWQFGPVEAGTVLEASYTLLSPGLQSPPAEYLFNGELQWLGGSAYGEPWRVMVSDASGTTQFLHAADARVGDKTYNSVDVNAVSGALATLSGQAAGSGAQMTLTDSAGIALFASNPVPSGQQWNLAGTWAAALHLRASAPNTIQTRTFTVHRIDAAGQITPLFRGESNASVSLGTDFTLVGWGTSVPAGTIIGPGERFGVEFSFGLANAGTLYLGFDASTQASLVVAPYTISPAPANLTTAHYRVGKDAPLDAMEWYAATDAEALGILRDTNFRLRFQVYNTGSSSKQWTPRLEYGVASSGAWADVSAGEGAAPFFVTGTTHYANGASIPTTALALGEGTGTPQEGIALSGQYPGGTFVVGPGAYAEVEFNLQATSAAQSHSVYTFRLGDGSTPLNTSYGEPRLSFRQPYNPDNPHVTAGISPDNCGICHRTHGSQGPRLRTLADDRSLCMTCHDGSGSQRDLSAEFAGSGNSQAQCTSCHDPHRTRTTPAPDTADTTLATAAEWYLSTNPVNTALAQVLHSALTRVLAAA